MTFLFLAGEKDVITREGEIVNLSVKIKSEGTDELIPIIFDKIGSIGDYDVNVYDYITLDGGITVMEDNSHDMLEIEVESVSGKPGDIVEIPLLAKNISEDNTSDVFEFTLKYNSSDIDIVSVESIYDEFYYEEDKEKGEVTLVFFEKSEMYEEGEVAKITAKINEKADSGFSQIGYINDDIYMIYPAIPIKVNSGGVMIEEDIIMGDINGDGKINSMDYVLLQRYVLEMDIQVPIDENFYKIGDINGDGKINSTDCAILKRYLLEMIDQF